MEPKTTEDRRIAIREILLPAEDSPLWVKIDAFMVEMDELAKKSEALVPAAEAFEITSEVDFQFADDMRVALQTEAKKVNDKRLVLTRPLEDFKNAVVGATKILIDNSSTAAAIWNRKALTYLREQQEIAREAQRQAEAEQRRKQEELNAAAARREAEAAKLKTKAAQQKKLDEADALRQAAVTTPVQMAVSAPAPVSTSSNVVEKWECEILDASAFLAWLSQHGEWQNIVSFGKGPMNRLAGQYKDSLEIPGVRIFAEESFRKKAQRG